MKGDKQNSSGGCGDPITWQRTGETYALCIHSVQLPPGPSEGLFPVSASERKEQSVQAGANALFINENGELKLKKGTKKDPFEFTP